MDMERCDRLKSGNGNAMLVAGSIYEACRFFDLFDKTDLHGKCAIITSYIPSTANIKGEETGEGQTDKLEQYDTYQKMLAEWFNEPPERAVNRVEEFEAEVKKKFIKEPGQMKLIIVVDKLLTGFDAPPATYLYIDKQMHDHGLFQAICRVNRLDGDDKEFGYIIDYKDLFKSLETAVDDYTSGALDGYSKEDVAGLLENRLAKAKEHLDEALEAVRALCEPVDAPKDQQAYYRYFSSHESGNAAQLKANEPQRLSLYKHVAALVRAYAAIASEMLEAGYSDAETEAVKKEVAFYENLRNEVKIHSRDAIDLKQYEPGMRHLIDAYIRAEPSETVSSFEDLSLIQLIVERGTDAVNALPKGIRKNEKAVAEAIENNVRMLIVDESPINPKYYEQMSKLLDALIKQRREGAIAYAEYLQKIAELTKRAKNGPSGAAYPQSLTTKGKRSLYDNLGKDEALALAVDEAVLVQRQDGWRGHAVKIKRVRNAIKAALVDAAMTSVVREEPIAEGTVETEDERADRVLELIKKQDEY